MSCSAVASYSDSSWELGVSAGQFNLKDSTGSYSGPSVGFNFIRNFNDWFSFEGNYLSSFNMGNANYDIQASTFSLAPVFTYHINDTFLSMVRVVPHQCVLPHPNAMVLISAITHWLVLWICA